jgi:hypothetical protein
MRIFALALLSVATAAAQVISPGFPTPVIPAPGISADLRQFLELTNDQVAGINRLNVELRRFQLEKARRAGQVRSEIQQETQKRTLDAMALGLRYLELEGIQRELTAKASDTATEVQKLFTAAQKTKLQSLEQVLRSYPVACEAVNLNFITSPASRWFDTGSIIGSGGGSGSAGRVIFGLTGISVPYAGCGVLPILTGDIQPPISPGE